MEEKWTVRWNEKEGYLILIDQRKLPLELSYSVFSFICAIFRIAEALKMFTRQ